MFIDGLLLLWRLVGLAAWPVLLLHPSARRHMLRVPVPVPGRTWIHGASLGEHRIIEAIAPHLGPVWRTAGSWRTEVRGAFPAPLDLPFVIGPWLDRARPSRLILVEAELWPGWILAARARGIPVCVVGGRRGRGWQRWQRLRPVFTRLMAEVVWIDSEETGPLKHFAPTPQPTLHLPEGTVIAASLRTEDERLLRAAWATLPEPRPTLILAPRHLDDVESLISAWCTFSPQRRTQLAEDRASGVLVLDTMGELDGLLPEAHTAIIGGTFDPQIGGHDPSMASMWGCHIVAGPHRSASPQAWTAVEVHIVQNAAELGRTIRQLQDRPRMSPRPIKEPALHWLARVPAGVHLPERPHRPWLSVLTPVWRGLSALHRSLRRPVDLPRPCVLVGGVVAGGAGRTPVAAWLAEHLEGSVILSAGYRRQGRGREERHPGPGVKLGDELEMLHRRGLAVVSAPDRTAALAARPPDQTTIIDGGLSDPRLRRAFRIGVIDTVRPTGGGPIPVGTQRLPWSELDHVDALWLSNWSAEVPEPTLPPGRPLVRSQLRPTGWLHRGQLLDLCSVSGEVDVAVGIAFPERFVGTLLDLGLTIRSLRVVRDHGELGPLKPGTIVTEKDAARLPPDADVWALRLDLHVIGAEALLTAIGEHHA